MASQSALSRYESSDTITPVSHGSTFVVKDAGLAEQQLADAQEASERLTKELAQGYIDATGNFKRISPGSGVNKNQFYPSVDSASPEQMENLASDMWGSTSKQTSATTRLDMIHETPPSTAHGQIDARTMTVMDGTASQNESQRPISSSMYNDGRQPTVTLDVGSTSDSIDLPLTATPPQSREKGDVFSTAVDEEILEAARRRQRRPRSLFQTEDWDTAEPIPLSMAEVIDMQATEHFQLGMQHIEARRYEAAIGCFNKALTLHPLAVEYFVQRAECFLHLCDFQSAILNYKRACVLHPDDFGFYSRLAFIYYFQGQCLFDQRLFAEALESFSRAAEMRPEVIGYHTRSIACLAALQRHGECLALVNKRIDSDGLNPDLYIMRARLHELFKNITLCYYDIKDALSLNSGHSEGLAMMHKLELRAVDLKQQAMHLNLLSRHRDALLKITTAIETNPALAEYHVLRGALNRRLGDFNAAIDDYLLAMDKTDHNEESKVYMEAQRQLLLTYNDFAVECFTKGFYEEAIILLNKAIKGEKREKGLYINRGDCFFRQDEIQFALADYYQALEIAVVDPNIRSRIAIVHNEYGINEYAAKNYLEAESRFTLAIENCPHIGQYYFSRSRAMQIIENYSGARQDLLIAIHLDPGNKAVTNALANLFPGKTVNDVMASNAAAAARHSLQNLLVKAGGSVVLKPIDGGDKSKNRGTCGVDGGVDCSRLGHPLTLKKSYVNDIKQCMQEHEFHINIVVEKAEVNQRVKAALQCHGPLCYTGGRVGALREAADVTVRSKNPLQKESLSVPPAQGWKRFGSKAIHN